MLILIAIAASCFFIAAVCQATTGFGFALVFVPLLSLELNLKDVVAISVIATPVVTLPLVVQLRTHTRWSAVCWLVLGSVAGAPVGALLLDVASVALLRMLVAAAIVVSASLLLAGVTVREPRRPAAATLLVGAVSGTLRSATSISGPPVVLYLLSLRMRPLAFVGTTNSYFLLGGAVSVAALVWTGQTSATIFGLSGLGVPVMLAGTYAGTRIRTLASERTFRRGAIALLFATAVTAVLPLMLARA